LRIDDITNSPSDLLLGFSAELDDFGSRILSAGPEIVISIENTTTPFWILSPADRFPEKLGEHSRAGPPHSENLDSML